MENNVLEIIKTEYGYKLTVPIISLLFSKIFSMIFFLFIGLMAILVDFENTIIQLQVLFKIVICAIIIFCIIYTILNNSKIKITEKDIAFCIGKRPFFENIKIELDKIKEISINYEMDSKGEEELTYYYNLDLIDYNFNAYRIIQSKNYNSICEFGNKIEKIIKKELVDKNDIEGYGHIFNKRIV